MSKDLKISTSITDFAPLFGNLEYVFKGLQQTGVNGVEIVIGLKSRWSAKKLRQLSEKYTLPITSIHQPIWSGLNGYFDEKFVDIAEELGTKTIVFHPLTGVSFEHPRMQTYLQEIARLQKKKHIEVCLENLQGRYYMMPWANYVFPSDKSTSNITNLFEVAKKYGIKTTIDIEHLHIPIPHKEAWFAKNLHLVGNIHLSSFTNKREHLPLYMGEFQGKEFVEALKKHNYQGRLTFEIYHPHLINLFSYNFEAIKKSVEVLT